MDPDGRFKCVRLLSLKLVTKYIDVGPDIQGIESLAVRRRFERCQRLVKGGVERGDPPRSDIAYDGKSRASLD